MVVRSRRQNSNGWKPCKRNQHTCKVHGAIEYDDSTLRQRNHAANDKTSSQLASHTIFTFVNVTLVAAGFVKRAPAELFRTIQGVIVPERPAVHCSMQSRRQQCHPNKYHSPVEWARCRVTDSHPPTNEPCRQTFAAHGRPRLSYREHHWIAPMRLTAAQPGPWLRPATLLPLSEQQ